MKITSLLLLLLAFVPWQASAFDTRQESDLLSYVAMPLAVSAVCDVRGVQTDRVGRLATYLDQANVSPTDFIDVFRYVPVALVIRSDGRPDFVEWVHSEMGRGIAGEELVVSMESQLRTYDDYVPVSTRRSTRREYTRNDYAYAYESDYVPVKIRHHCDDLVREPLSMLEMPVAVTSVCDLGVPVERVSSFAIELNLGRVPPLQFVELMRYAPAALVVDRRYQREPDFVQFVRTRRLQGSYGYPLVQDVDRQLRVYDVQPRIDYASASYGNAAYPIPARIDNYVAPYEPQYIPPTIQTRMRSEYVQRAAYTQAAPAFAAPQTQRLLTQSNGAGFVATPEETRRELARSERAQREMPRSMPAPAVTQAQGRFEHRGNAAVAQPMNAAPAVYNAPRQHGNGNANHGAEAAQQAHGNGKGHGHEQQQQQSAPAPQFAPQGRGKGHGQQQQQQQAAPAPQFVPPGRGKGHEQQQQQSAPAPQFAPQGRGKGHGQQQQQQQQQSAPAPQFAPQGHGKGHGQPQAAPAAAPVFVQPAAPAQAPEARGGKGHGGGPPANNPAAGGPPAQPPGQEKKHGKDKH
jgi:hypothetical protein